MWSGELGGRSRKRTVGGEKERERGRWRERKRGRKRAIIVEEETE
jgi:hypothetical protein